MGTMPDTLLAKKFNLNKLLIFKYRQKLGILKFTPQKYRIVPEVLTYIKNKCGTVSDAALAMETGTTVDKIFQIRVALQKPSWRETVEKRKKSMIQEIKPFLGTGSDRAVGVNFGINPQAVRKIRVQLGIPATFRKG